MSVWENICSSHNLVTVRGRVIIKILVKERLLDAMFLMAICQRHRRDSFFMVFFMNAMIDATAKSFVYNPFQQDHAQRCLGNLYGITS
jgi:hypothetical protein